VTINEPLGGHAEDRSTDFPYAADAHSMCTRAYRASRSSLPRDRGQGFGDGFEGLALGVDAERHLDQPTGGHDEAADHVADGQAGAAGAVADERAEEERAERAEDLGDGEEDRDRFGADLDRRQVSLTVR